MVFVQNNRILRYKFPIRLLVLYLVQRNWIIWSRCLNINWRWLSSTLFDINISCDQGLRQHDFIKVPSFLKRPRIFSISSFKGLICGVPVVNIVRSLIRRLPCNHQIRKLLSVLLEIAAVSADAGCRLSTFVVDTIHLTSQSETLTYW